MRYCWSLFYLDTLRFPLILPTWFTNPPASIIRFISRSWKVIVKWLEAEGKEE